MNDWTAQGGGRKPANRLKLLRQICARHLLLLLLGLVAPSVASPPAATDCGGRPSSARPAQHQNSAAQRRVFGIFVAHPNQHLVEFTISWGKMNLFFFPIFVLNFAPLQHFWFVWVFSTEWLEMR